MDGQADVIPADWQMDPKRKEWFKDRVFKQRVQVLQQMQWNTEHNSDHCALRNRYQDSQSGNEDVDKDLKWVMRFLSLILCHVFNVSKVPVKATPRLQTSAVTLSSQMQPGPRVPSLQASWAA